jgi:hypothetical protein
LADTKIPLSPSAAAASGAKVFWESIRGLYAHLLVAASGFFNGTALPSCLAYIQTVNAESPWRFCAARLTVSLEALYRSFFLTSIFCSQENKFPNVVVVVVVAGRTILLLGEEGLILCLANHHHHHHHHGRATSYHETTMRSCGGAQWCGFVDAPTPSSCMPFCVLLSCTSPAAATSSAHAGFRSSGISEELHGRFAWRLFLLHLGVCSRHWSLQVF